MAVTFLMMTCTSYLPTDPPIYFPSDSVDSDVIQLDELLNPDIHYRKEEKRKEEMRKGIALVFGKSKQDADNNNNESVYVSQSIMYEIFKLSWKLIKPLSRWSSKDPALWKTNIVKKRRADGLPYVTKKSAEIRKYLSQLFQMQISMQQSRF